MPYKEHETQKLYYTMGEVADLFGVNQSLIRFWEKEFEILQPKKNRKGNRLFTPEDLENLKMIFYLVKDKGFTLEGAKAEIKSKKNELINRQRTIDSLKNMRSFLVDLGKHL